MSKEQSRDKALTALLDSTTLTEAAEKAGISRKTLYNYLRTDLDFARAYRDAREQLTIEHLEAIEAERQRAKQVIAEIMDDTTQPSAVRLKAAQIILNAAGTAADKVEAIAEHNVNVNSGFSFD